MEKNNKMYVMPIPRMLVSGYFVISYKKMWPAELLLEMPEDSFDILEVMISSDQLLSQSSGPHQEVAPAQTLPGVQGGGGECVEETLLSVPAEIFRANDWVEEWAVITALMR